MQELRVAETERSCPQPVGSERQGRKTDRGSGEPSDQGADCPGGAESSGGSSTLPHDCSKDESGSRVKGTGLQW